ncbi:hypothetical protein CRM22_009488 [Opisthorchis felineus]|uniref:Uncharacterized protein n=1 Tax=Opisthorchis felineus TaxID=147828 RepID=A0A4S2L8P9_OPIFE|nr:hypothetical protein CRM22_009488 [Opisthorchis felineus]
MDTFEPDDFVFAIVQIPPGQSSERLLDSSDPATVKCLRKFCKRIAKRPSTAVSRPLPCVGESDERFMLSVKDGRTSFIPFVGKGSEDRWYLRHLPTHRLVIQSFGFDACIASTEQAESPENTEHSIKSPRKRKRSSLPPSPQLITSSDEEQTEFDKLQKTS